MAECLLLGNGDRSGDATASAADILSGKTAYIKGNKVYGGMPDCGLYKWAGRGGHGGTGMGEGFENGVEYYAFNDAPSGYYHNSGNDTWSPELRLEKSVVRRELGVSAEKIVEGNAIAGVAGTAPCIRKLNHKCLDNKSFSYPNTTTRDFTNLDEAHGNWYLGNYPASNGGWLVIRVSCGTTDAEAEHRQMAWCTIGTNTWREVVLRPKYTSDSGNYSTTVRLDFWRSANGDLYYHPMRGSTYGIFTTSIIVLAQTTVDLSQWS